jgi:hypothetical protein
MARPAQEGAAQVPECLSIDFPIIGAAMTIRTESNKVFIFMRSTRFPRNDVVEFHIDMPTGRDGAFVASLDEDAPTDFSRYWRAPLPV